MYICIYVCVCVCIMMCDSTTLCNVVQTLCNVMLIRCSRGQVPVVRQLFRFTRDFPLLRISLYKGFPFTWDFPV